MYAYITDFEEFKVPVRAVLRIQYRGQKEKELGLGIIGGEGPSLLGWD